MIYSLSVFLKLIFLLGGVPENNKGFVLDQPKKSSGVQLRSMSLDLPVNAAAVPSDSKSPCAVEDDGASIREEIKNFPPVEVVFRRRDPASASARNSNRLSVISSESDRRYKFYYLFFFYYQFALLNCNDNTISRFKTS